MRELCKNLFANSLGKVGIAAPQIAERQHGDRSRLVTNPTRAALLRNEKSHCSNDDQQRRHDRNASARSHETNRR